MNAAGRLVIASPPKWLPLVEVLTSSCIHQEGTKVSLSHTSPNLQATKAKSMKCEEYKAFVEVDRLRECNTPNYSATATNFQVPEKLFGGIECRKMDLESPQFTKPCSSPLKMTMQPSVNFIASTPEVKPPPSATAYHVTFVAETPNPHGRLNSSPLPCIASRFTPFPSPILETPVVSKTHHMSLASPKHMSPLLFSSPSPEQLVTPAVLKKSPQCSANLITFGATGVEGSLENCNAIENGYLPGSSAVPETGPFKSKSLETSDTGSSGRTIARSMGGSQITNPQLLPDLPDGEQKLLILSQQQRQPNVSHVSQCQLQGHGTSGEMGEPESSKHRIEHSNEISNDERGVESTGVLASMPRPRRRFKRLKKACKLMIPTPPSEPQNNKQNLWCSVGQEHARVRKTTMNFGMPLH
jgi:hypothetical protein